MPPCAFTHFAHAGATVWACRDEDAWGPVNEPMTPIAIGVPFGFVAAVATAAGSTSSAAITTIENRAVLANLLTSPPWTCHCRARERPRRGRFVESYS